MEKGLRSLPLDRHIEGNLLWVASLGSYVHSMQTALYFESKAAIGNSYLRLDYFYKA